MMSENDDQKTARSQSLLGSLAVFIDVFTLICAFACSFWIIFLVYEAKGIVIAILVLPFMALFYIPGPAPTFAIAASILYFYFHVVDPWLPVISYMLAVITLFIARKWARMNR